MNQKLSGKSGHKLLLVREQPGAGLGVCGGTRRHTTSWQSLAASRAVGVDVAAGLFLCAAPLQSQLPASKSLQPQSRAVLGFAGENYLQQDPVLARFGWSLAHPLPLAS